MHSFTVEAYDHADEIEVTHTYRVAYPFSGFFSPLTGDGSVASVRAGGAVPVTLSLTGDRGLVVVAGLSSAPVDCVTGAPEGQRGERRACRSVAVALVDGTTHRALLRFTK